MCVKSARARKTCKFGCVSWLSRPFSSFCEQALASMKFKQQETVSFSRNQSDAIIAVLALKFSASEQCYLQIHLHEKLTEYVKNWDEASFLDVHSGKFWLIRESFTIYIFNWYFINICLGPGVVSVVEVTIISLCH